MANSAALIRAANPGLAVTRRGRRFLEFDLGGGKRRWVGTLEPLHLRDSETEIDTTWTADTGAWQYKLLTADYNLHARNVLNAGDTVQWSDPGSGESVTLQPLALNWVDNATDSRQQITQPQAVTAVASDASLFWANGYGTGRHFRYTAHPVRLLKELIIDAAANLPAPTVSNPYLELEFVLKPSTGVTLYCDGVAWDRSTKTNTPNAIEFRTASGQVVWRFAAPVATDAAGSTTPGILQLRRGGATRYVTVRFPKTWLDTATYPVTLDPTLDVQPDATAGKDTKVSEYSTTLNYGTAATLEVNTESGFTWRNLIQFDLSELPAGATIDSATLHLWVAVSYEWDQTTLNFHRVLSGNADWTEAGAKWAYQYGTTAWAGSAGCSTSGTDYAATAMATKVVAANLAAGTDVSTSLGTTEFANMLAANYGLIVWASGSYAPYQFDSSDSATAGERPKLVVEYTEAGTTGTVAMAAQPAAIAATGTNLLWLTGTVAMQAQQAAIAAAGTQLLALTGTAAMQAQAAQIAATGTHVLALTGTAALTGQAAQIGATGTVGNANYGTAALTGQPAQVAAIGTNVPPAVTGTASLTGQPAQVAATGVNTPPAITGTVAVETPQATIGATGAITFTGTAALDAQAAVLGATGTVTQPGITGTATFTARGAQIAATGVNTPPAITGTVAMSLPMAEISATDAKIQAGRASLSDALAYRATVSDAALSRAGVTDAALYKVAVIGDA